MQRHIQAGNPTNNMKVKIDFNLSELRTRKLRPENVTGMTPLKEDTI